MAWDHFYVTYGTHRDLISGDDLLEPCMVVVRVPIHIAALSWIADLFCRLTRHYFCNSLPMEYIRAIELEHSEDFPIAVEDEVILRYTHWRKWPAPFWLDDDDEDDDDEKEFARI